MIKVTFFIFSLLSLFLFVSYTPLLAQNSKTTIDKAKKSPTSSPTKEKMAVDKAKKSPTKEKMATDKSNTLTTTSATKEKMATDKSNAPTLGPWAIALYSGKGFSNALRQFYSPIFMPYYMVAIAGDYTFHKTKHTTGSIEGIMSQHWRDYSSFAIWNEFALGYMLRYVTSPIANRVFFKFGIMEGVSYATKVPFIERETYDNYKQHFLNYLGFEIGMGLTQYKHITLFWRLHHRSGVFGLYNGINGGSNHMGGGIRYTF